MRQQCGFFHVFGVFMMIDRVFGTGTSLGPSTGLVYWRRNFRLTTLTVVVL
jgi:hypothetical protein